MSKPKPEKTCAQCGRPFTWRKKWERCWEEVRFCSERCKGEARRFRRSEARLERPGPGTPAKT